VATIGRATDIKLLTWVNRRRYVPAKLTCGKVLRTDGAYR